MRAEKRLLSGAAICGIYIGSSRDREQPNNIGKPNGGKSTKLRLAAHKETTVCAVFWLQRPIIFFPVLGSRQRTRPLESRWLGLTKYSICHAYSLPILHFGISGLAKLHFTAYSLIQGR